MHLFVECIYDKQIWDLAAIWTQHSNLNPTQWEARPNIGDWWVDRFRSGEANCKQGQASLIILILWQIW